MDCQHEGEGYESPHYPLIIDHLSRITDRTPQASIASKGNISAETVDFNANTSPRISEARSPFEKTTSSLIFGVLLLNFIRTGI